MPCTVWPISDSRQDAERGKQEDYVIASGGFPCHLCMPVAITHACQRVTFLAGLWHLRRVGKGLQPRAQAETPVQENRWPTWLQGAIFPGCCGPPLPEVVLDQEEDRGPTANRQLGKRPPFARSLHRQARTGPKKESIPIPPHSPWCLGYGTRPSTMSMKAWSRYGIGSSFISTE